VFGSGAAGLLLISVLTGGFFIWHRISSGQFTPHIWAGFVSAFLFGLAMLVFALGQIAQMVARLRVVQEQQLYILRSIEGGFYGQREAPEATPSGAAKSGIESLMAREASRSVELERRSSEV
jgi:hypothetical protein